VSLGVTRDDGQFEWADSSIARFFCQLGNVASPRMWRMVLDVVRFNHAAAEMVAAGGATTIDGATAAADTSAAQWLDANGYSAAFRDDYLMPRVAALWGISPDQGALQFPISMVARHLWDSRLLGLTTATAPSEEPTWLTLVDGSRSYVDAVMRGFPPNHLFLNTPVRSVRSMPDDRVVLELADGSAHDYDHVILACHGDEAYRLIRGSATPLEREILSQFQTVATDAVLHSDASVMPRSRTAWSGWNYATTTTASARPESAAITYNLNMLQDIPRQAFGDVLLTVNPGRGLAPRPETVQSRFAYRHGLCTPEAVAAQARLPEIQNTRGISYAGAWTRLGLHEDGISSGLAVARDHLGARLPFAFAESSTAAAAPAPRLGLLHYVVSVLVLLLRMVVAFVTAVGSTVDEETAMVQARAHGARVRVKETKAAVASGVRRVLQAGGQHGREGAAATGVNGVGVVRRQQVQNGVAH
jgi:predicted NAD/FAD-binding protein